MNASTTRSIVGVLAFVAFASGLALYSVPLALTVCGLLTLAIAIVGEVRPGFEPEPQPPAQGELLERIE